MGSSQDTGTQPSRVKRHALLLGLAWTAAAAASLAWNIGQERDDTLEAARSTARAALMKDLTYRRWNLSHGGVYVPQDQKTLPNPFLATVPERDITTASGKQLTLVNPEYMTRQAHDLTGESDGWRTHVASLRPLRPQNGPDLWEAEALHAFAQGQKEMSSVEEVEEDHLLRLMWPLVITESCLSCHAQEGYALGDVKGGISISVPMTPFLSRSRRRMLAISFWHVLLWLLGLGVIYMGVARLLQERKRSEIALKETESRFRHIYEYAPVMMYSIDGNGCICDANRRWLEETGYTREEVIGQKADFVLWGKDTRFALAQITPRAGEEGQFGTVRCQYFRKNGSSMDVLVDRHVTVDPSGNRVTLAVVHNITERNRAEAERKTFARLGTRLAGAASLESILAVAREESDRLLNWDACHFSVRCPTREGFCVVTFVYPREGEQKVYSGDDWPEAKLGAAIRPLFKGNGVIFDHDPKNTNAVLREFGGAEKASASAMFVPVQSGDNLIGIMSAQSYTPGRYGQAHIQILHRLADSLAPALERSHAEQALREQNDTLTMLNSVAQVTTGSLTGDEMCDRLLEVIRGTIPCDAFFVDFYDLGRNQIHSVRAYDTIDGELRPVTVPDRPVEAERRLARHVIKEGKPLLIHRKGSLEDEEDLTRFGDVERRSASLLFAPMVVGSRVIGLISTQSYTAQAYTERDVVLVEAIARQIGPALEAAVLSDQLRQSEQRFRTVIETAADSIFMKDVSLQYTLVNPAMEKLFRVQATDLIGRTDEDLFGPESGEHIEKIDRRVLQGETVEEQHTKPIQGKDHTFHVVKVPMRDRAGNVVGLCGIARDMTERKNLEDQLRQAAKMEAVGQLAGGIAHDFNNLLQGIIGYASLIKLGAKPGDKAYQSSEVIESTAERACELTQQLLGFARRGKIRNIALDLHETILEVLRLLTRTIDKRINITQNLRAKVAYVLGDPGQMQQVFLNLAINARDAMPDGGTLTFETDVVFLDEDYCRGHTDCKPGEYVLVSVSDTGRGIAKELQDRIFEPFFTTKEPGTGTGMGLAMVYGIVRNHGGSIRVYSEEGHGATFKVYLPLAAGFSVPRKSAAAVAPIRGTGHILVIDDEEVVRSSVSTMLRRLGYKVTTANDGMEGVEIYEKRAREIDLVIIDMIMPRMDGRDCFLALKKIRPDVKAVLSTGYSMNGTARSVMDEGMLGLIQKPYRIGQLSEAVAAAMKGFKQPTV